MEMSQVWFSVVVLISMQQVFALYRDCSNLKNIRNCNECIRCGGHWCNDPKETKQCTISRHDNWCVGQQEKLPFLPDRNEKGDHFNHKYSERTINIGKEDSLDISFTSKSDDPKVEYFVNSTQTSDFIVSKQTNCNEGICTITIAASPENNFCSVDGGTSEHFNVKLAVEGISEEAVVKFHVPCACACSDPQNVVVRSPVCNLRGNFSCGVCACENEWTGTFCDKPICENVKRGDVPCVDTSRGNTECSGNGVCGQCDRCECFIDRPGSRYFDKDNYCADICMTTNDCDACLLNPTTDKCPDCNYPLYRQHYNSTLLAQKDDSGRHIWVACNSTINDCYIEYVAMRDHNDDAFYMIIKSCDPVQEGQVVGAVNLTLPIVLGVIALAVAAAATAGYMVWKNRAPPMPLTDPMYQNIDAEDCRGENPLYKPPTSSFKNPTYGKW